MSSDKKQISSVEWGLVIGALFTVDIVQWGILLITAGIGAVINEYIDLFVGMSFTFYLYIRGQMDGTKLAAQVIAYFTEAVTGGGAPVWGLDGLTMFFLSKKEKILEQVPGGKEVSKIVEKK